MSKIEELLAGNRRFIQNEFTNHRALIRNLQRHGRAPNLHGRVDSVETGAIKALIDTDPRLQALARGKLVRGAAHRTTPG